MADAPSDPTPDAPPPADDGWWERFRALLDTQYEWPAPYTFKFIAPVERLADVEAIFPGQEIRYRASSKGAYASLTLDLVMDSAENVEAVYRRVAAVPGVRTL